MNVHIAIPTPAEIIAREIRLGKRPQNAAKPRLVSTTTKPAEPRVANAVWQREHIWFDAHVEDYRKSSKYANNPQTYLNRRSLELGFTGEEIIRAGLQFEPYTLARRVLAWDLRIKWGLSTTKIGLLLNRDHSCIWLMLDQPKPTEEQASMRLTLPSGQTYMWAIEKAYYDGMPYEMFKENFKISISSIQRLARYMDWPYRRADLTKKALQSRGKSIAYLADGWERTAKA